MAPKALFSSILDWITSFESQFPVAEWTVGGIHAWPLLRIKAANGLFHRLAGPGAGEGSHAEARASWLRATARAALGQARTRLVDPAHAATARSPHDVVFLTDGLSVTRVQGRWYENFCDPMVDALAERGLRSLVLSTNVNPPTPRYAPTQPIALQLRALTVAARLGKGTERAWLPELGPHLQAQGVAAAGLSLDVTRELALVRTLADHFKRVLARTGARLGVVVCYYNHVGMAFNLACRELGIPSIDLQHGVQGDNHRAYGRWTRLPAEGFALLPELFWCWREEEASAIKAWNGAAPGHHQPIVGGNLLLQRWETLDPATRREELERLRGARGDRPLAIACTLSGLESEHELQELTHAMATGDADWFWWLRCHPARPRQADLLERLLAERGFERANVRLATQLPLYSLLRDCRLHVTARSSSVIEAQQLAVPSVFWSADGAEFFERELASGWAVQAAGPAGLVAAMRAQLARSWPPAGPDAAAEAGLTALLARLA